MKGGDYRGLFRLIGIFIKKEKEDEGGGQSLVDYGTISWRIINTSYIHNRLKNTLR